MDNNELLALSPTVVSTVSKFIPRKHTKWSNTDEKRNAKKCRNVGMQKRKDAY